MFNDFLKKSRHETLTFDSFQNILAIIKDRFAYTDYEFENEKINEECKLFLEFVGVIYSRSQYKEIQLKLNKILHSVLVYTFYTKISSEENIFSNKSIYIDTNIIIYLIGANLKFRKIYIEELLELLKLSKSKLLISKVTLLEFARTLKNPNNTYLKFFVENQRVKVDTILANPKSYIYELFSQYDIDIEIIDCDDIEKMKEHEQDWDELYDDLASYKAKDNFYLNNCSLEHDIHLLKLANSFFEYKSITDITNPLITADNRLYSWIKQYSFKTYLSSITSVFHLQQLTLYLWLTTNSLNSKFIMKTWMYIVDSIKMFDNMKLNSVFRIINDTMEYEKTKHLRSLYLLVKQNTEISDYETDDQNQFGYEQISSILKNISSQYIKQGMKENQLLEEENIALRNKYQSEKAVASNLGERLIISNDTIKLKNDEIKLKNLELSAKEEENKKQRQENEKLREIERQPIKYALKKFLTKGSKNIFFRFLQLVIKFLLKISF